MIIREMADEDLTRMTEIVRRGCEHEQDIDRRLMCEKTLGSRDNDRELSLVADLNGRVVGFAQGVISGELDGRSRGCVRVFGVDRAHRQQGIATLLFDELEARMIAKGAGVITIMDSPANYFTPGVDFRYTETNCFLLQRGYEVYRENRNMRCDLHVDQWPQLDDDVARLEATGLTVRRGRMEDESDIVQFLMKEWKGWVPEVTSALDKDPPGVFLALQGREIVGFAAFQGNNKTQPFFGPMGTSPQLRGRGVGAVLLRLCLRDLARQGWSYAVIPWVGPIGFYLRHCGARLDRSFWAYKKLV